MVLIAASNSNYSIIKILIKHRTHQQDPDGKWVRFTDHEKLKKATELSKQNILKYRQIGLLEEFDSTLKLLEATLPEFYSGALEAYHGPCKYNLNGASFSLKI